MDHHVPTTRNSAATRMCAIDLVEPEGPTRTFTRPGSQRSSAGFWSTQATCGHETAAANARAQGIDSRQSASSVLCSDAGRIGEYIPPIANSCAAPTGYDNFARGFCGIWVVGRNHVSRGSDQRRARTRSSATSTIMSSCPPTILRRPSSTRIVRVSRSYVSAAFSAWRRKLE